MCSINLEKPMSSFGGSSQGMMSLNSRAMSGLVNHTPKQNSVNNPHKDDGLPKKSKFQKKKAEPSDNKLPFGVTVKEDSSFEYSARNSNKRASRKPDQEFKLQMNDMKHHVEEEEVKQPPQRLESSKGAGPDKGPRYVAHPSSKKSLVRPQSTRKQESNRLESKRQSRHESRKDMPPVAAPVGLVKRSNEKSEVSSSIGDMADWQF